MPLRTTKPLTTEEAMTYRLVAAAKKFIDPGLGFRSIEPIPPASGERRWGFSFLVPGRTDPDDPRRLRVGVRVGEVRLEFRRGRWAKAETFVVSDPEFERKVTEFIGRHWNCYFSTYWMSR